MKSQLNIYDMSKEKFYEIFEVITDAFSNEEYFQYIVDSESDQEIFDFLQLIHPGSYSFEDLENFLKISLVELYKNSKEYTCNQIFKYTIWDIYKNHGRDYLKLLVQLDRSAKDRSNMIDDLSLNVAGGVGGSYRKRFDKILAAGLAVSVPLTSLGGSGTSMAMDTRFRKSETSPVTVKRNKFLEFFDKHRWIKWTLIGLGSLAGVVGAYHGIKYLSHKAKLKKAMKSVSINQVKDGETLKDAKEGSSLEDNFAALAAAKKTVEDVTKGSEGLANKVSRLKEMGFSISQVNGLDESGNPSDTSDGIAKGIDAASFNKLLASETLNQKINVKLDNVESKVNEYIVLENKDGPETKKYLYKLGIDSSGLDEEKVKSVVGTQVKTEKDNLKGKDEGINIGAIAAPIGAITGAMSWLRDGFGAVSKFAKEVTDTAKAPSQMIRSLIEIKQISREDYWNMFFPKTQPVDQKYRTYSANEIYENLRKYIKGQDEQLLEISKELSAFIMKTRTSDKKEADKNRQMTSGCSILMGPPGSGKSMLMLNIKDNIPYDIRAEYLDLSKWDGKEAINTYIGKQKEFEALLTNLNGQYAVLMIEELDKICSTPEKKRKFDEWAHNLYDSGRLGGCEKSAPATLKGVKLFCTTNAIPDASDFEEGRVVGAKLQEGQTGPDIIEELALKGGRSLPQPSHGSTKTRQRLYEFYPPNDEILPDVIDSNMTGICDAIFKANKLDIQWNQDCLKKLASLIHTKKYMSGGNRKIVKDILDKLWDLIIQELNPKEDAEARPKEEDGTIRLWLDFGGVDANGNLILSLVNTEDEVTNKAEGLVIEDSGNQVEPLTPEMAKYILDLKLVYLSDALLSLSDALTIDSNRDWGSYLDDGAVKCISDLARLISRSSDDVNENIKTLVKYIPNLMETLRVQKISDSMWENIKNLRSSIKNNLTPYMRDVKHSGEEDNAFRMAESLLSKLKKYDHVMKLLGRKLDSFAKNNHFSILQVCDLFEDFENVGSSLDGLQFLLNLPNVDDMNRKMSNAQINAITKLNEQLSSQLKVSEAALINNAKKISDAFMDISKLLKENKNNLDISTVISSGDNELLSRLIKYVGDDVPEKSIDKLNFVINKLNEIKPILEKEGVSEENLGLALGIRSKIESLIHPKTLITKEVKIDSNLEFNFGRLIDISKELSRYSKYLSDIEISNADRQIMSTFIPSNLSNPDKIKYISNNLNNKPMVLSLNNAYSKGEITNDQIADLVGHLIESKDQLVQKVGDQEEFDDDDFEDGGLPAPSDVLQTPNEHSNAKEPENVEPKDQVIQKNSNKIIDNVLRTPNDNSSAEKPEKVKSQNQVQNNNSPVSDGVLQTPGEHSSVEEAENNEKK